MAKVIMPEGISGEEQILIAQFREADILQDVVPNRIDQSLGVVSIICSDADRSYDTFMNQVRMQDGILSRPRIHQFAWHGGVLACACNSPVRNMPGEFITFQNQILSVSKNKIKDMRTILPHAHAPCGAAKLAGLTLEEVFQLYVRSLDDLATFAPEFSIVPMFHVDYGDDEMESYFFSLRKWHERTRQLCAKTLA